MVTHKQLQSDDIGMCSLFCSKRNSRFYKKEQCLLGLGEQYYAESLGGLGGPAPVRLVHN